MRNNIRLKPGERIDELQRNGYGIIQSEENFCFGMDAVLLSGFARVKKGEIAVDLGTGTGIIPILLEAKTEGRHFYGLEIQPEMAEMAARSVRLNCLEEKIDIINGDICDLLPKLRNGSGDISENAQSETDKNAACEAAALSDIDSSSLENDVMNNGAGSIDSDTGTTGSIDMLRALYGRVNVVTSNPPYMKASHGLRNPEDRKAIARHEVKCSLSDVCEAASRLLCAGGRFYMVHRPLRLPEIISEMKSFRLEPKRIKPVYPFIDKEANMVLIEAVRNAAPECRFEKPVIVYKEPGKYTDEIYDIYGY